MPIEILNELTTKAMGGTELMAFELQKRLDPELLDKFQIIPSRVRELDPNRIRILWCHDLPGDPESEHLANGGWEKFHKIIFVSNWQMQGYISRYGIPWSHCYVMQNAIHPLEQAKPYEDGPVRFIYHTTPHRGLNILLTAYSQLAQEENVHLDVFSSFRIYGWAERDIPYQHLFDYCEKHDKISYHGSKDNSLVRDALQTSHVFAYPCKWQETSCIALLEAMSSGLMCVHSNLGALPETSANWTRMYQFQENEKDHAEMMYHGLKAAVDAVRSGAYAPMQFNQKQYVDLFYNWDLRAKQWELMLQGLL